MRHRSAILSGCLVLALATASAIMLLVRPSAKASVDREHWRITRYENGKPVRSEIHLCMPRDSVAIFADVKPGTNFVVEFERVTVLPISDAGWFSSLQLSTNDLRTVEFLLLLPPATLLVCFFRNVIGLTSFGVFAPALLGLAFREVQSPLGIFVVLTIIAAGWWLRRGLNELHLLQVPRTSLLLSCIVVMLLVLISVTNNGGTQAITLFPLVILTGIIERFWAMEEENGAANSIGALASTFIISLSVWLLTTQTAVSAWLLDYPETLGFVMAAQILIGRYTGFRIVELYRFRELLNEHTVSRAA